MTTEEYQKEVARTAAEKCRSLANAALGLTGEAGEVSEIIKKHLFHGRELSRERVIEELGDLLWYVSLTASMVGATMDDVMGVNVRKLREMYPTEFNEEFKPECKINPLTPEKIAEVWGAEWVQGENFDACSKCGYPANRFWNKDFCPNCFRALEIVRKRLEEMMRLIDADKAEAIDPVHAAGGCYCRECRYCLPRERIKCELFESFTTENDFCSRGRQRVRCENPEHLQGV